MTWIASKYLVVNSMMIIDNGWKMQFSARIFFNKWNNITSFMAKILFYSFEGSVTENKVQILIF